MKSIFGLMTLIFFSSQTFAFSGMELVVSNEIREKFEASEYLNKMIDDFENAHSVQCVGKSELVIPKNKSSLRLIKYTAICSGKSEPLSLNIYSDYSYDRGELVFRFQKVSVKKENNI